MAWCFSTRASVATVLTTHPCVSRCLRVKHNQLASWGQTSEIWTKIQNKHCNDSGVIIQVWWSLKSPVSRLFAQLFARVQIKENITASLTFLRGIHWWSVDFPHKWSVTWKMFPFDDITMVCSRRAATEFIALWDLCITYLCFIVYLCRIRCSLPYLLLHHSFLDMLILQNLSLIIWHIDLSEHKYLSPD